MKHSAHQPSAREAALRSLQIWEDGRLLCDSVLEREIRSKMSGPDADLAAEIFLGSIRWRARLDFVIDQSTFKVKERSLRLLLHGALFQLLFLHRVPTYAVVDEAVKLSPARSKKLVNAFLRGFLREMDGVFGILPGKSVSAPKDVVALAEKREELRKEQAND